MQTLIHPRLADFTISPSQVHRKPTLYAYWLAALLLTFTSHLWALDHAPVREISTRPHGIPKFHGPKSVPLEDTRNTHVTGLRNLGNRVFAPKNVFIDRVHNITQGTNFVDIQSALAASVTGDIIEADAGTYAEGNFTIPAGVKLTGAGKTNTTIEIPLSTGPINLLSNAELTGFKITRATGAGQVSISTAISPSATGVKIKECDYVGNRTAIYINGNGNGNQILDNSFDDNRTGILFADLAHTNYLIQGNTITNNRTFGVLFLNTITSLTGITINHNNISGNGVSQLENNGLGSIDAANNYFGTSGVPPVKYSEVNGTFPSPADHPAPFTPLGAPYPYTISGSNAAGINICPYYTNATLTTSANCPVFNFTQNKYYLAIQPAINEADAGDEIRVSAGTFIELLTISKALTLKGANVGVNPNTGTRTAETVLDFTTLPDGGMVQISGSGKVVIDGFKLVDNKDGVTGSREVVQVFSLAAHQLQYNIFERISPGAVSSSSGTPRAVSISPGATGSVTINANLFTGSSAGIFQNRSWRTGIYSNGGGNTTGITNNVFKFNRSAINADDYTAANNFTGNTFQDNGTAISFGGTTPTTGNFTLSGNSFSGSGTHLNLSNVANTFLLDATGNTFAGIAPAAMTLAQLFTLESQLIHRLDAGKNGFVTVKAGNVYVTALKASIQRGIDAATAGNTVHVQAGTFSGTLLINKSLTLNGAQKDICAKGRSGAQSLIQVSSGGTVAIDIQADNVTVNGFQFNMVGATTPWTITAINEAAGNGRFANTHILNNEFIANNADNTTGGMYLNNQDDALIECNYFNDLGNHAVFMAGSSTHTIYRNNDSFSCYNSNFSAHDGFHTNALVENNRAVEDDMIIFSTQNSMIQNNTITGGANGSSRIYLGGNNSSVTVKGNTITNSRSQSIIVTDLGFYANTNSDITIENNTIQNNLGFYTGNSRAIDLRKLAGTSVVSGNTVNLTGSLPSGVTAVYGIGLQGSSTGTVGIDKNVVKGNNVDTDPTQASSGILLESTLPAAAIVNIENNIISGFVNGVETQALANGTTVTIHNNNLAGNSAKALFNAGTAGSNASLDATCNWYGSANIATVTASVSGPATFQPFLQSGTDNEAGTIGFQPVPGSCATPVITLSPATLPTGTVGSPYSQTVTATGGTTAYTFALTSGSLPNGLTLASGGNLSGTPTVANNFSFTITATDANGYTGSKAYSLTINAAPVGQQVVSFTLVNANNEQDIQTLTNGATLNLATLPTKNLNIRANTSPATVGSVVFKLSGQQTRNYTEGSAPYALFGDNSGNYNVWVPAVGSYTLKATPFTSGGGGGTAGTPLTVNFSVVNQASNQPPVVSHSIPNQTATVGTPFNFTFAANTFSDPEGSPLTYTAKLSNNSSLPSWLSFNGSTRTFSGTQPSVSGSPLTIRVTASDGQLSNFTDFMLTVNPAPIGQQVVSFTLVNANNEQDIQTLTNGATLNLATLPTKNLNIRANTSPATVGSVVFKLSGQQTRNYTEGSAPYALFGDNSGNYNVWVPAVGSYTLKATPFTSGGGGGTAGTPLTVNFSVVNQGARLAVSETSVVGMQLVAYPNPTTEGQFKVVLSEAVEGEVSYVLVYQTGVKLTSGEITLSEPTSVLSFNLSSQMRPSGVYYLRLEGKQLKGMLKLQRQ